MTPFYFGSGARRLFGIYDPPAKGGVGTRAALLCHPWGDEYLYAHRALRRLAIRLSAAGFHTLRFDFFGTGDSAGDLTDADLAGWEADTALAMEELRDIADARRITLIGLRLGGSIAARVASRSTGGVESLVLWDPVISGADYPAATRASRGFPMNETMRREMQSIELGPLLAAPASRTFLAITDRRPLHARLHAVPAKADGGSLEIECLTDVHPWLWTGPADLTGVIPAAVIGRIMHWLE